MKIDAEDIDNFRWYIDDHLDEVVTTLKQYKQLCLEDESLALLSEDLLNYLKQAQEALDKASLEMTEVGLNLFGKPL